MGLGVGKGEKGSSTDGIRKGGSGREKMVLAICFYVFRKVIQLR